jgi:hypothetical protein
MVQRSSEGVKYMPSRVQRRVRMVQHRSEGSRVAQRAQRRSEGCSVAQLDAELGWVHRLSSRICFSSTVQFLLDFYLVDFDKKTSFPEWPYCPGIPSIRLLQVEMYQSPEWRLRVPSVLLVSCIYAS